MLLKRGGTGSNRVGVFRTIAITAVLGLVLSACTGSKDDADTTVEQDDKDVSQTTTAQQLQDIWMFHDLVGVDDEGKSASVIDLVVSELTDTAQDPVALTDDLNFAPLPELVGTMASPDGTIRDDISVTFGLFGIPEGSAHDDVGAQTLGFVTSAPTSATNVSAGDELVFNVGQFEALNDYTSVLLDYVFGQAKPAGADVEENLAPLDVLAARFAAETVEWSAIEIDGELEAGMWSGVAGNPNSVAAKAAQESVGQAETTDASAAGFATHTDIFQTANNRNGETSIVQTGLVNRMMGFPVKDSFTGKTGLALTGVCIVAAVVVTGPAAVVVGSVFCTTIGVIAVLNDAMNAIEDNTPGGNPRPGRPGTSSGEPHLTTFDGARHDLMAVGEFDMFIMDDMRLQLRTKPYGTSKRVSINTAAAMDVAGDTIVADSDSENIADIMVNDEPTTLEIGTPIDLPSGGIVKLVGNAVDVEWPDGRAVTLNMHSASLDAVVVLPEEGTFETTGLLGDADGNADNDFFTREGETFDDLTTELFYDEVVESWRVTEADNLFGQPLTHDPDFPDFSPAEEPENLAWATAICASMGLTGSYLEDCITDVSATEDVGFAKRAAIDQAIHNPMSFFNFNRAAIAAGTGVTFEGTHLTEHAGQMDQNGHALIQLRHNEGDKNQLHAVTVEDGEEAWSVPMQDSTCGVAVAGADRIVVPGVDDDGFLFQFVDSESGSVDQSVPSPFNYRDCLSMVTADDTVIVGSGGKEPMLLGLNSSSGDVTFEQSVPDMTVGPVRAEDGTIWVVTENDDRIDAHEVDVETGKVTNATTIPGDAVSGLSGIAPTADGFVVTVKEEEGSATVRVANGSIAWRTEFPVELDGRDLASPGRISVDDQTIAGYTMSSSSFVVVLDTETGEKVRRLDPSSFNNNGGQVAHHDGNIIVGTFGGKAWIEAYDPDTLELVWSEQPPDALGLSDAKQLASLGDDGFMVLSDADLGNGDDNTAVQFFKP